MFLDLLITFFSMHPLVELHEGGSGNVEVSNVVSGGSDHESNFDDMPPLDDS